MFAMLTGNLPFTVEPFNIKQLHRKMISGDIGSIQGDVSKGEAARAAEARLNRIFLTRVQECASVRMETERLTTPHSGMWLN